MKSLFLRVWLTVVAALALFALVSGWLWQRHVEQERAGFEAEARERVGAWGELLQRSLPAASAPAVEQAQALREWSQRLGMPLAIDDAQGRRVAVSDSFVRRDGAVEMSAMAVRLDDGRTLWIARRPPRRPGGPGGPGPIDPGGPPPGVGGPDAGRPAPFAGDGMQAPPAVAPPSSPRIVDEGVRALRPPLPAPWWPFGLPGALAPAVLLGVVFVAVAAGAYPVVRRLTRRLEALKQGVEAFGAGALSHRVDEQGRDEVAAVAATFNRSAARIEALVRSHQSLLANASHELRSPLARLRMAVQMFAESDDVHRAGLKREIDANVGELDALVEEVLLASRLDAAAALDPAEPVELLGLAAEEAARVGVEADGESCTVMGSERLLRRALRNLLENARRYGGDEVQLELRRSADGRRVMAKVSDRGPGVPEAFRERIFEPFFRLPGHAEREGGVGLGLSLVRQIAERHHGSVRCEPRPGGGSCFVLDLPTT